MTSSIRVGGRYLVELVNTLRRRAKWAAGIGERSFCSRLADDLLERTLKNSKTGPAKSAAGEGTFSGIVSTIESWLDQFETRFACWDKSRCSRSTSSCAARGAHPLPSSRTRWRASASISRLVLRKIKDRVLTDANGDPESKTTIVFDEFADLHGLADTIYPLYGRSRSSQCQVITAWQSWPAVCVTHSELMMAGISRQRSSCASGSRAGVDPRQISLRKCARRQRSDAGTKSHAYGREYTRTVSSLTEIRTHVLPGEFHLPLPRPGRHACARLFLRPRTSGPVYFEDDYQPFIDFLGFGAARAVVPPPARF